MLASSVPYGSLKHLCSEAKLQLVTRMEHSNTLCSEPKVSEGKTKIFGSAVRRKLFTNINSSKDFLKQISYESSNLNRLILEPTDRQLRCPISFDKVIV